MKNERYNARKPCAICGERRGTGASRVDGRAVTWTDDNRFLSWSNERRVYTPDKPPPGIAYTCDTFVPGVSLGGVAITCPRCYAARPARLVIGVFNPKVPCNAKCINARGFSCECSCGGENHGAGMSPVG